jgi:DNA mismatch repair protein MutL
MASLIKILPDHVVNKIAAGEVVERPASVVKELIENSIDAGANEIFVEIEQAGRRLVRVTDDGCGISKEDARTAFMRHATSKIETDQDLEAIRTMGFRGEALSSIASVAQVRMLTAMRGAPSGVRIEIEAGKVLSLSPAAAPQGTSIEVANLFYNTPARLKFLKSPGTEFSHIASVVSRQAMAFPSLWFRLTHNKKRVFDLPPSMSIKERAFQLYGGEIADNVIMFSGGRDGIHVHGLLGRPAYSRAERTYQDFYVNNRPVKNPSLTHALYSAYGDMLMRDRHPVGFIFVELDPALVDVNVHPAKAEVRFRNQSQIHDLVRDVIREGLRTHGVPVIDSPSHADAYGSSVREALTNYLKGQQPAPADAEQKPSSFLLGRRKSDVRAPESPEEPHLSSGRETSDDLSPLPPLLPAQDVYPLAQVHDSFIVAQSTEGMVIIDQHAAHERILYEKLQDEFGRGEATIQQLLMPDQIDLGPAQSSLLAEYLPELGKLGFAVEDYGGGTFMIKAVPSLLEGADYKKLLLDILDEVNIHGGSRKMEELRDSILSVMACHPAIKVHRKLTVKEMDGLLHDLYQCRMPHTCPHGRPTALRFSIDEINKMFKRT